MMAIQQMGFRKQLELPSILALLLIVLSSSIVVVVVQSFAPPHLQKSSRSYDASPLTSSSSSSSSSSTANPASSSCCRDSSISFLPSLSRANIAGSRHHSSCRLFLASQNNNNEDTADSNNDSDNNNNKNDNDNNNKRRLPLDDDLFRENMMEDAIMNIFNNNYDEGDDDDDDDDDDDEAYTKSAPVEFTSENDGDYVFSDELNQDKDKQQSNDSNTNNNIIPSPSSSSSSSLARQSRSNSPLANTPLDWGSALTTLRTRVSDAQSGKSSTPSHALFRTISIERPNEAIGRFVREANPEVVAAMTGAVSSLLGSLSNPSAGVEVIVQASGEKIGNLCFQLMMTGYMFRNAEYVLALKSLMNIKGEGASLEEYQMAFNRLDKDGSGYLEVEEVEALLADVYGGKPPAFEVQTFLEFFDSNNDGRISWEEFEKGFGVVTKGDKGGNNKSAAASSFKNGGNGGLYLPGAEEEEDGTMGFGEPTVSGTIKIELQDGKVIEVDAQDYMNDLKEQALELKRELAKEKGIDPKTLGLQENNDNAAGGGAGSFLNQASPNPNGAGGIASYIASLQGDVQSLTQGISPEVVDSMKMLIDFVLEGGPSGGGGGSGAGNSGRLSKEKQKDMELPGSALQQLALWQLVIGYRLRETEATGEWRKMLE